MVAVKTLTGPMGHSGGQMVPLSCPKSKRRPLISASTSHWMQAALGEEV